MIIDLFSYQLEFIKPLQLFNTKILSRKGLLISINGQWGEVAPLEGFSIETYKEALDQIIFLCEGKNLAPLFPSVSFGFSSAINGLKQITRTSFASLGVNGLKAPLCAKIKLHDLEIEESIIHVTTLIKNYPNTQFRLDCNQKWTLDEALYFASHFKKEDFDYIEEPVQTFDELLYFYEKTKFPIALDETLYRKTPFLDKLPAKAYVIKPTMIGGMKEIYPYIALAKKNKSSIVFSSSFESGIGIQNIIGLANHFSIKSPLGIDTLKFFQQDLLKKPLEIEKNEDTIFINPNVEQLKKIASWKLNKKSFALLKTAQIP